MEPMDYKLWLTVMQMRCLDSGEHVVEEQMIANTVCLNLLN